MRISQERQVFPSKEILPMNATAVTLKLRVRLPDGRRRYLSPVQTANGKLKSGIALLAGKPQKFDGGVYHLRYVKDGRRIWEADGCDAQLAELKRARASRALTMASLGLSVEDVEFTAKNVGTSHTCLDTAIADFLVEVSTHKSKKTLAAYSLTLRQFRESCSKKFAEEIDRKAVLAFAARLKEHGNGPRTVSNRVNILKRFLAGHLGRPWPLAKSDRPRYTQKAVAAYGQQTITALLSAANQEEADLIYFFLGTGCREGEVIHTTWRQVDFEAKTFEVKEDLALGFTPKDKEEGAIPIPDFLLEILHVRRKRHPKTRLIFPSPTGGINGHCLRIIKRLALRAGLNCRHCYNKRGLCCAERPVCTKFDLHRFRKSFATLHHEAGVSVRTIQRWLRHSSLDTTLHYLAASDDTNQKTREQVNSTFAFVKV
jgi:integrase/recombinase XerD